MSFAQPFGLLALLLLVPLAAAWGHAAVRHRRADVAYGGSPALRSGRSVARARLRAGLLAAGIVLAAIAIARPRWGNADTPLERTGIDIVIALDISRSMQAADVQPSRAAAAASGLQSMLDHLGGDRVGLVTFGGSAFARSPLTLDVDAVADLVTRAQREGALVRPGSDIGAAISESLRLLDVPDRPRTQVIVLVSDGEDLAQNAPGAIGAAQREHVPIHTVAAGTEQGGLVPPGENARDAPAVVSRADRAALARIANETGGSTRDIATLAGLAVDFSRLRQSQLDEDSHGVPVERFQWVVGAALSLLLVQTLLAEAGNLSFPGRPRARVAAASLLCITAITGCSGTAAYQRVREGNTAFDREDFTAALSAYVVARELTPEDPIVDYNMGNAFHRLERYDEARTAFTDALKKTKDGALFTRATYGVGNAAFSQGALDEARAAYVGVLQRDPSDHDARHNLEVVLRALQQRSAGGQPVPAPAGEAPGASPTPGAGAPGAPQPTASPLPAGSPGPSARPGRTPGSGPGSGGVLSEAEARAELERLLRELPEALTAEEALRVLDAAQRASELGTLQRSGGAAPDPNDR